jgi:hypothetical protein
MTPSGFDLLCLAERGFAQEPMGDQYIDFEHYPGGFGATEEQDDRRERITFNSEDGTFYAVAAHVDLDGNYWFEANYNGPSLLDVFDQLTLCRLTAPRKEKP